MEMECGGHKGGWTTIVKLNISKGDSCPSGWTKITAPGPKVVCRSGGDQAGCDSTIFNTYNVIFNKICGQVTGYQKGLTVAFYGGKFGFKTINKQYVDGVSITLGNPRKHVWTYATGFSDDGNFPEYNCPCAAVPGIDPPAFVGHHYYCESGDTGEDYSTGF